MWINPKGSSTRATGPEGPLPGTAETAASSREGPNTISGSGTAGFDGLITIVDTEQALGRIVPRLLEEPVVGFDIESKPCFKKGEFNYPSLLQLATASEVLLIKLLEIKDRTPLIPFLESERVVKAGVGIRDDVRRLATLLEFSPGAFIEIGTLAQKLGYPKTGLAFLTRELFGQTLSKRARLTNWERKDLTPAQVRYAAADAHLSREIYLKLLERLTEADLSDITFCTFPSIQPLQESCLSRL